MRGAVDIELIYDPEDEQTQLDPYSIYRGLGIITERSVNPLHADCPARPPPGS